MSCRVAFITILVLFAGFSPVANATLDDRLQVIESVMLDEIEYKPFLETDIEKLATDPQYNHNWTVYTNELGQKMVSVHSDDGVPVISPDPTMDELLERLNNMEKDLNKIGMSLRNEDGLGNATEVYEYYTDPAQFRRQLINAVTAPLTDAAIAKAEEYLNNTEVPHCPQLNKEYVFENIADLERDELVTIPSGDKLKAEEYIDYANNTGKVLCLLAAPFLYNPEGFFSWDPNGQGFPQFPAGTGKSEFLSELYSAIASALSNLNIDPVDFMPSSFLADELYQKALEKIELDLQDVLANAAKALAGAIYYAAQHIPEDLEIPRVPSIPGVEPNPQYDLEIIKRKEWPGFAVGNHDLIGADAYAYYELRGKEWTRSGEAYGRYTGYLLGNSLNFASGRANFRAGPEEVSAEIKMKVFDYDVMSWKQVEDPLDDIEKALVNDEFIAGLIEKGEILSDGAIEVDDVPFRYSISESYGYQFFVGPIPVNVELGANGYVQLHYEMGLNIFNMYGALTPSAGLVGWADGAVGLKGIVSAGVEADLLFLEAGLPLKGYATVDLDENDRPILSLDIVGEADISALDGSVKAYAEWVVPRFGIPPWKKKKKKTKIFGWSGLHVNHRIMNWGMTFSEKGVQMRGDLLDQTDFAHEQALRDEVNLQNRAALLIDYENEVNVRVYDIVIGIQQDLSSQEAMAVSQLAGILEEGMDGYTGKTRNAVRQRLDDIRDSIFGVKSLVVGELEADADNDGLTDLVENNIGTSSLSSDSDDDGIPDFYEHNHPLLDPLDSTDALLDLDGDGYTNLQEYVVGTSIGDANSNPEKMALVGWLIPVIGIVLH